jgi:hypothetical protein
MATESVATVPAERFDQLERLATEAGHNLFQIKSVMDLLADHPAIQDSNFPSEISGAIAALHTLVDRAHERVWGSL